MNPGRLHWTAAILGLLAGAHPAVADLWEVDLDRALQLARGENRVVLMDFTGSDWCGWCKRLEAEVLSTGEFEDYARQNLVCVRLDFPRSFALPPNRAQRNMELAQRFGVKGFPTLILLDSAGDELGRTGYQAGGATAYIRHLEQMLAPLRSKATPLDTVKKIFSKSEEPTPVGQPGNRLWLQQNGEAVEGHLIKRDGDRIHVQTRRGEDVELNLKDLDAEDRAFVEQSGK